MSFKWRSDARRNRWIYDAEWAVEQRGGRWYVVRDGRAELEDYGNALDAIEAAERRMV